MSEEHKQRTREMIKVMQAYVDGQEIEANHPALPQWRQAKAPVWDFTRCEYRIVTTPDSIDWSHVAAEFKYMARDEDGDVYVYPDKPKCSETVWVNSDTNPSGKANCFSSYRRGTVDWKDSLVERPE